MAYNRKDSWYRKAKEAGYRSRAAYKLIELNHRGRLLRPGMRVVDLGCAPGGFLQVAAEEVGVHGRVVGIDRLEMKPLGAAQVVVLLGDVAAEDSSDRIRQALGGLADLVLSDMAPNTSGCGFADHARSMELVRLAAQIAKELLRPEGTLVVKAFDGADLNVLVSEWKKSFGEIRRIRPESTRKESRELYLLAKHFLG